MNTTLISTSKTCLQRFILPSLTGRGWGVGLCLACLLFWACSSSDDENNSNGNGNNTTYTETSMSEAPVWAMDWYSDQERPNWTKPDGSLYENWTTMMVKIEDALVPYVSDDDLMALFVNDEVRGLAKPAVVVDDNQQSSKMFLMKVYGNETGTEPTDVSLRYYCHLLKHIFTLKESITLDYDGTLGTDEDFIPAFTLGSTKYPVVKAVVAETLLKKAGIIPFEGNKIGAFVDDECRGMATLSSTDSTLLVIYGREAGESVTLKYYDAAKEVLYTITDAVKL